MKKRYAGMVGGIAFSLGILLGLAGGNQRGWQEATARGSSNQRTWERKQVSPAKSKLKDVKKCWLCGNDNRSLMGYFRKFDGLGIICVNNWYVLDMRIRNQGDNGEFTEGSGGTHSGYTSTGEGGCVFSTEQMSDRGLSRTKITYGEDGIFDIKNVQKHLCQTCLDKLIAAMESYGYENEKAAPKDLCIVDFQTLELYSLQEHNISHFIRDYYVQMDVDEEEATVMAVYAPVLENGEK
ncbi:MAG: hypothetical protein Q4D16_15685 [Eubacteriales bacterium]|nr:hypothetical protein [Eubacteriales bacterium]